MRIGRIAVVSFIYGLCSCSKASRRPSTRVVRSASSHRRRAGSAALGCAVVDRFWRQFGDGVRRPPHPQRCRCCIRPRGSHESSTRPRTRRRLSSRGPPSRRRAYRRSPPSLVCSISGFDFVLFGDFQVEASMNLMARNKMRLYDLPSKLPCDPVVCSTSSSRFLFLLQRGAGELFPQPLTGRYVRFVPCFSSPPRTLDPQCVLDFLIGMLDLWWAKGIGADVLCPKSCQISRLDC